MKIRGSYGLKKKSGPVNAGVIEFGRNFLNEKVSVKPTKITQDFITRHWTPHINCNENLNNNKLKCFVQVEEMTKWTMTRNNKRNELLMPQSEERTTRQHLEKATEDWDPRQINKRDQWDYMTREVNWHLDDDDDEKTSKVRKCSKCNTSKHKWQIQSDWEWERDCTLSSTLQSSLVSKLHVLH